MHFVNCICTYIVLCLFFFVPTNEQRRVSALSSVHFSFCAVKTLGRFPIPSSIHSFSCRRIGKEGSLHSPLYFFLFARSKRKSTKKEKSAAQNGLSLTTFINDGAANSLRSNAAWIRHWQTQYPVFDRSARP